MQWRSPADAPEWLNDRAAFLLTVVNPHADPPALFPSKANGCSISCASSRGPCFGDLFVSGAFDEWCWSDIGGNSYVNTTVTTQY